MRFRLWTILYAFALLAAAMATIGALGIPLAVLVLIFWGWRFSPNDVRPRRVFVAVVIFAILILVLNGILPAVSSARWAARRNRCINNMKQLALALHLYSEKHGTLPPAYIPDQDGKPMHSWRVLILPYLEREDLYDRYDFDEPWDGANNRKLWSEMPDVFRCPSAELTRQYGLLDLPEFATNYFAVVGPETLWRGNAAIQLRGTIPDGTASTLMLIESVQPICWMQPNDLGVDDAVRQLTGDAGVGHPTVSDGLLSIEATCRVCNTAFADGGVSEISREVPRSFAKALLTVAGGEKLDFDRGTVRRPDRKLWSVRIVKWRRVYSLGLFVALALLPVTRFSWRKIG